MEKVVIVIGGGVILLSVYIMRRLYNDLKQEREVSRILSNALEENRRKIYKLEDEIRQYEYFTEAIGLFHFDKATKVVKNNNNDIYIVMDKKDPKDLWITFSGLRHPGICNCPRILATVRESYIWIDDIFAEDEDCGNGTLLLECLFEKARDMGVKEIRGELAAIDEDEFDKLEHFYKKNGFEVWFSEDRKHGGISKIIE